MRSLKSHKSTPKSGNGDGVSKKKQQVFSPTAIFGSEAAGLWAEHLGRNV